MLHDQVYCHWLRVIMCMHSMQEDNLFDNICTIGPLDIKYSVFLQPESVVLEVLQGLQQMQITVGALKVVWL